MEAAVQLQTAAEDARSLLAAARTDWGGRCRSAPGGMPPIWSATWAASWCGWPPSSPPGSASAGAPLTPVQRTLLICPAGTWPAWTGPLTSSAPPARLRNMDLLQHRGSSCGLVEPASCRRGRYPPLGCPGCGRCCGGPSPDPLDGDVAAAGIEEFMIEFLPGLLAQQTPGNSAARFIFTPPMGRRSGGSIWRRAARPYPGTSKRTRPFGHPLRPSLVADEPAVTRLPGSPRPQRAPQLLDAPAALRTELGQDFRRRASMAGVRYPAGTEE